MSDAKCLVFSIIQFLSDQLQNGNLSNDASESLEVAIQCLEQAYNIKHDDVNMTARLQVNESLLDIFNSATKNQQARKTEASDENKANAEQLKAEGNNLMKAEKYKEALECYTQAVSLDGSNAVYYCNRAAAYNHLGNYKAAIDDCDTALKIDPSYSKAYGRKGLAHTQLKQYKEAKICYENAVKLEPDKESHQTNLRIAEEKLREANLGSQEDSRGSGMFSGESGIDFSNLLNNPALMNMATQVMGDPNMQQMLGSLLAGTMRSQGGGNEGGMDALLQAGQQLAAQMQASNPELVEQLRRQMLGGGGSPNPPNPDSSSK